MITRSIFFVALIWTCGIGPVGSATFPVVDTGFPVVDTGQTLCYGSSSQISCPQSGQAFFGQDAQHDGKQPGYQDNGDGTVTDLVSDLMWQQTPAADKSTFQEAMAGAAGFRLAGYDDWRLPSIKELYSLISFNGVTGNGATSSTPYLDTGYFDFSYGDEQAGERFIDAQYCSSTEYLWTTMQGSHTVFGVNFADGRIKGYGTSNPSGLEKTFFVRYVRGQASDPAINLFHDNGDGTITDRATGLIWSATDSGRGMTWEEALAWVEQRNAEAYLGYRDWRLPNAKELQSLVDYTRAPDVTASAAIDPLFVTTAIVNEGGQTDYPYFWSSTTHLDGPDQSYAVYIAFGRALGYMQDPRTGSTTLMDVHGAGAQRSDPKSGNPGSFPSGHGPQGDVVRIYSFVRPVRGPVTDDGPSTATFTYWVEIAANLAGEGGSRWLTDLVLRNNGPSEASVSVLLHSEHGDHSLSNRIAGSAQAVFEDVVGLLGYTGKGSLEIRSDQPLQAVARIYNRASQGTFGQLLDAYSAEDCLATGESAWLLGLRQLSASYRSNLSITNTGASTATILVELFTADGNRVSSYPLEVAPSQVVQDLEPFATRAGRPNSGWGFAKLTVTSGRAILASASVVDSITGDATTIPMKR